jgi:hypothetical protein
VSEWPKWLLKADGFWYVAADKQSAERASENPVEVIPADLGRELYEASMEVRQAIERGDNYVSVARLHLAHARYEREVGK